jgi:serine/threonine-protein kinase
MQQEIWFQKYKILSLLGRGGTAKVYLAQHIKLNSYRAIKCISKSHPLYDLQRKEALILKNLKHSCIPIIYDIEEDEDGSYIVEQYIEGETLKGFISSKGSLKEDIIIHFGLQLCDLIHYLHSIERPVLYVDLKPDNIILSGRTLKLIDFGSAVYRDELTYVQEYSGTKGYAAPELYRQSLLDERCDVYGIGMLLYYMVTGQDVPKNSKGIDNIDHIGNCSKQLKNIINNCLKYNPSQRYSSVEGLIKQLSTMKRKDVLQNESSQTLKIAIAGAQPRIGVTHFSLQFCNYFKHQKLKCLYQEMNDSGCVRAIKNRYEGVIVKEGIYELKGIPMHSVTTSKEPDTEGYQFLVQDYGQLTKNNLAEFIGADLKILILGAKDWELEPAEQVLTMVAEYEDIDYLFNFMNGRQFQQVMKSMEQKRCYRIPYEPDLYTDIYRKKESELFYELINLIKRRVKKRGKLHYEAETYAF